MDSRDNSVFNTNEFPSSHRRGVTAGDEGEAHSRLASADRGVLPPQLEILADAAHDIADRVRRGSMSFLDAVDFVWSAAEWAELIDRYGPDEIQEVLSEAFMECPRA